MANHKSALKRARQNEKRHLSNRIQKTRIKNIVKKVQAQSTQTPESAQEALREAMKVIDRSASKGAIHKKTASRKIARLSRMLSKAHA